MVLTVAERRHFQDAVVLVEISDLHFARSKSGPVRAAGRSLPRSNYGRFRDRRPCRLTTTPVRLFVISHRLIITWIPAPVKWQFATQRKWPNRSFAAKLALYPFAPGLEDLLLREAKAALGDLTDS